MEQVYTRIHSNEARAAGIPHAQPSITIGTGNQRCVTLKMPSHARITDMAVKQRTTEVQVDFKVELLKSKFPFPPDIDQVVGTPPADDLTLYRIIPRQDGIAGTPVEVEPGGTGYAYRNMDGTFTDNQRFIYIVIIPDGALAPTTWDVSVTCALEAS